MTFLAKIPFPGSCGSFSPFKYSKYICYMLKSWGKGVGGRKGVSGNFTSFMCSLVKEELLIFSLIFLSITRLHKGVKIQDSKL